MAGALFHLGCDPCRAGVSLEATLPEYVMPARSDPREKLACALAARPPAYLLALHGPGLNASSKSIGSRMTPGAEKAFQISCSICWNVRGMSSRRAQAKGPMLAVSSTGWTVP